MGILGKLRLAAFWDYLRSSLWFVPALLMVVAVALASSLVAADSFIDSKRLSQDWPFFFGAGAAGSRGMLSAIATSMITLAGVAFSITIVVLSLASSQYSPRILRNFMRDRTNQIVLGTLVGIYAYCLLVLRSIRGGDEGAFVPSIAVLVAIVLALVGVGSFIYFIHHIAYSIQADSIIRSAADETIQAIDRLFPEKVSDSSRNGDTKSDVSDQRIGALANRRWQAVLARNSGFLRGVDYNGLSEIAQKHDALVRVKYCVGDFVIEGVPLVEWSSEAGHINRSHETTELYTTLEDQIHNQVHIGRTRTMSQDPGFGIRQIVDIALRALSSGVNDTTTAVTCVHYLCAIVARLADRMLPSEYLFEQEQLLVVKKVPDFERMVGEAFDLIRQNAEDNSAVVKAMLVGLRAIEEKTWSAERRMVLAHHMAAIAAVPAASDMTGGGSAINNQRGRSVRESCPLP